MNYRSLKSLFVAVAALTTFSVLPTRAQTTVTWTDNGTGVNAQSWSSTTNWSPAVIPGISSAMTTGDFVVIGATLSTSSIANPITVDTTTISNSDQNVQIGSLTFNNTTSVGLTDAISEFFTVSGPITNTTSATDSLALPVVLGSSATFSGGAAGGTLNFGSTVDLQAHALTLTGTVNVSTVTVGGVPSSGILEDSVGGGTLTVGTVATTGTVTLANNNTFGNGVTNGVTITNGTLSVPALLASGTAQPLGEGATVVFGGTASAPATLLYTGGGTGDTMTLAQNVTVNSGAAGTISNTSGNVLTVAGTTISNSGGVLNLSGGAFDVTSHITGAGAGSNLKVIGGAAVTLANTNSYAGTTSISGNSSLVASVAGALPTTSVVTLGAATDTQTTQTTNTLDLDGKAETISGLASIAGTAGTANFPVINQVVNSSGDFMTANNLASTLTITPATGVSNTFGGTLGGANAAVNFSLVLDAASSTGTQVLTGANTYTGGTTVTAGTLVISNTTGSGTGTGAVTLASGSILSGSGTISGATTANGATISGTGLTLSSGVNFASGSNTLSGTETATTGASISNAATVSQTGTFTGSVSDASTGASSTFAGVIAGANNTVTLTNAVTGTLTLSGANTYTGGTTVNGGKLVVSNTTGSGTGTGAVTLASGTTLSGTGTISGATTANGATISGTGLALAGGVNFSSGANTLSGTETAAGGASISNAATVSQTGTLTGSVSDASTGNSTFAGVIAGSTDTVIMTNAVTGTLTLSGANTYTGGTTVNGGTLVVSNTTGSGTGTGAVTLASGTTLSGTGSISGLVTDSSGATIAAGASPAPGVIGTLHVGSLTIDNGGILDFDLGATTTAGASDSIVLASGGTLTFGSSTTIDINAGTLATGPSNSYTLISGATTIAGFNAADFTVSGLASNLTAAFSENAQDTALLVTFTTSPVVDYFYTGAPASGSATDFNNPANYQSLIGGGVAQTGTLTTTSTDVAVILGSSTPAAPTGTSLALSQAADINSLTFNATGSGDSVTGNSTLTIGAGGVTVSTGATDTETISAGVALSAAQAWTVNGTSTLVDSGGISGAFGLTKAGTGTLTLLSTSNSYGTTTISGGTLQIGNGTTSNGSLGSGAVTDNSSLVFEPVALSTSTIANAISGSGTVTQNGPGTTLLSGANTYTGATIVSNGTLAAGIATAAGVGTNVSGAFGNNSAVTVVAGGTLDINAFNTQIGSLTGTGGTVTDSGAAATLTVGGDNTSPSAFLGVITGSLTLTKIGTGTLSLSGVNTYTGATAVSAGTLSLTGTGALSGTSGITTSGSGVFTESANASITGLTTTFAQGSTGTSVLGGTNSYGGATTVTAGTLSLTGTLNGTSSVATSGSGVFSETNAGVIGGAATFTQGSTGTSTLAGTNTYNGATMITAGTLQVNGSLAGGSAVSVTTGGTLAGDGTVGGTTTVTAATINGTGLTLTGLVTFDGTGNKLSGTDTASAGVTLGAGAAVLQTGTLTGNLNTTSTGTFTANGDVTGSATVAAGGTLNSTATGGVIGGATTVNGGTINGDALTLTGLVTFNGAGNILSGTDTATAGVTLGAGTTAVVVQTGTLTGNLTTTNDGTFTANGVVTGTATVGAGGTLNSTALGGSIGGATTVNGGTINGDALTLTGLVTFNNTGNTLSGTDTATAGVTLGAGAAVTQTGTLTGNLNTTSTGTFTANGDVTGTATVASGGTLSSTAPGGIIGGTTTVTGGTINGDGLTLTGLTTFSSGANTLSGTETATAGAAITGSATVTQTGTLTGSLTDSSSGSSAFGGVIAGPASTLTQSGTGTLTLSGVNTYAGTTTISAGTLQLNGAGTLGAGALTLSGGGTLALAAATNQVVGAVTITGPATISSAGGTLSGASYADSATSGTATISADLVGNGALTKSGAGTLVLSGTDSYAGATSVSAGTLNLTGTLNGTTGVTTSGTGVFTESAAGVIRGGATFAQNSSGISILNGPNTYTGGTTISAGTLEVGPEMGNASAFGTGNVNQTGGTLEASVKTGTQINITGNYMLTGGVNGGTLVLNLNAAPGTNGQSASNDLLNVTGTASLNGKVDLNFNSQVVAKGQVYELVASSGISGPGSAVGPGFAAVTNSLGLQVNTAFLPSGSVFPPNSAFPANDPAGTNLYLVINSVALQLSSLPGITLTPNEAAIAQYLANPSLATTDPQLFKAFNNLLTPTASLSGVESALSQLDPSKFANFAGSTVINNAVFSTQLLDTYLESGRTANGDFAAGNGQIDSSGLTVLDPTIDSGLAQTSSRLLAWSPAPLGHGMLSDSADPVIAGVDSKAMTTMAPTQTGHDFNVFVAGNVVLAQGFSQPGVSHSDSTSGAVQIGADYRITPHLRTGVMFGYQHTDADLDNVGSKATIDSYAPGAYASFADKGWYANVMGSYGFNNYTEDRAMSIGGASGVAHGAPDGSQVSADLDGGYDFHLQNWTFGPLAGLQYTHVDVNGFSEDGAGALGADEIVARQETDSLRSRLGGHVAYLFQTGTIRLTPHLDASWQHEFMDQSQGINAQIVNVTGGQFTVKTTSPSRDAALLDCGLDADLNGQVSLFGDYLVQAGQSNYFGQSVQAGVKIGF